MNRRGGAAWRASARRVRFAALVVALAACGGRGTAPELAPAPGPVGPSSGALVLAGGGALDPGIIERFVELAGGPEASIVLIPTATAGTGSGNDRAGSGLDLLQSGGARNVTVLHTDDPREADDETFVAPLKDARGVWFLGGRQWRLVDAYLGTRTHRELIALLERGGVIGGSSAGASIQASFLIRGAREGNHIIMAPDYLEGFGFLQGVAVDQHLLARNRQDDLLDVLNLHPHLLGIGIDEGTAIVVRGDILEVLGASKVAVYESGAGAGARYYFLEPGARYDMRWRRVLPE